VSIAETKQTVLIEDVVARRLPLRPKGSHLIGRCPFHEDGGRPNLVVFPTTQRFKCFACGAGGDAIDFIARMDGISLAEAAKRIAGEADQAPRVPPPLRPKERTLDLGKVSATYYALLRYLELRPEDRQGLLARGLSKETVKRRGYRTLPAGDRESLPLLIQMDLGPDALNGVPGFFLSKRDQWELAGAPGLLIPVMDPHGRIVGIQIRATKPGRGRYRWLSSAGKPSGVSPGSPCHAVVGRKGKGSLWITEGPLKADVVAEKVGVTALGVTGVSAWRRALPLIRALGAKRAILAFDRDEGARAAEAVVRNVSQLAGALSRMGVDVLYASWDEGKGVDDALMAGGRIRIGRDRG